MEESILRERAWRVGLGVLFALLVAGIFVILPTLSAQMSIGLVAAWTMTILAVIGAVALLVYGFIIERIHVVALEMATLQENVAKSSEIQLIAKEVNDAARIMRETYSIATKELLVAAQELGLDMIYLGRAEIEREITGLLTHAKREVKFLGISISIPNRMPAIKDIVETKAKDEGVSFRFLFLQRKSTGTQFDFYRQRAFDENYPTPVAMVGTLEEEATRNIGILQAIRERLSDEKKEKLEIAEYEAFPYMSLIIIDDVMFVGPYLFSETCPNTPMYRIVKTERGIYHTYNKHFDALWRSAKKAEAKAALA